MRPITPSLWVSDFQYIKWERYTDGHRLMWPKIRTPWSKVFGELNLLLEIHIDKRLWEILQKPILLSLFLPLSIQCYWKLCSQSLHFTGGVSFIHDSPDDQARSMLHLLPWPSGISHVLRKPSPKRWGEKSGAGMTGWSQSWIPRVNNGTQAGGVTCLSSHGLQWASWTPV